jgi:hypothetical protein
MIFATAVHPCCFHKIYRFFVTIEEEGRRKKEEGRRKKEEVYICEPEPL